MYIYICIYVKGDRILPNTLAAHWTRPCPQGDMDMDWIPKCPSDCYLLPSTRWIPRRCPQLQNTKCLTPQSLFLTRVLMLGPWATRFSNDRRWHLPHRIPLYNRMAVHDTGDFWNHTRLSYDCVPICSFAQVTPYLLLAFCFKVRSSSKIRKRPSCKTVLKRLVSITLVKQSASIMAVEIHLHCIWSLDCSFRSITSIVVLHSWQLGTAFFITKS